MAVTCIRSLLALSALTAVAGSAMAQDSIRAYSVDGVTHSAAAVGLTAAELDRGALLAQAVTVNGVDRGLARLDANGGVRFQEDANGEHVNGETVDVLALSGDPTALGLLGEIGRFTYAARQTPDAVHITFERTYNDPLVFAQVATYNGGQPISAQVDAVSATDAYVVLGEPAAYDGSH